MRGGKGVGAGTRGGKRSLYLYPQKISILEPRDLTRGRTVLRTILLRARAPMTSLAINNISTSLSAVQPGLYVTAIGTTSYTYTICATAAGPKTQEIPGASEDTRGDQEGHQRGRSRGIRGTQETPVGPEGTAGGSGERPRGPEGPTGSERAIRYKARGTQY